MATVYIDDVKLDNVVLGEGFEIPSFNLATNSLEVAGVDGAYTVNRTNKAIEFELPLIYKNHFAKRTPTQITNEIVEWINHDKAVKLQFSDEDWYWLAEFDGSLDIAKNTNGFVEFSLKVILNDPYKHGVERSKSLNREATIVNSGTAQTKPIFELDVTKDSMMIYIGNLNNLTPRGDRRALYIGQQIQVDQPTDEPDELILHDTMQSTSGWTTATSVDSGQVTGNFGVDGNGFFAESYGEEPNQHMWTGPSVQKSIGVSELQHFKADIKYANRNEFDLNNERIQSGVGIIEVYFRDINGNKVAKCGFGDSYGELAKNSGVIEVAGSRHELHHERTVGWNNFDGLIRIGRDWDEWFFYIAQIINGQHTGRANIYRIPSVAGISDRMITTIQVALRKYTNSRRIWQRIKEIKVWKIQGQFGGTPNLPQRNIFKVGDRVKIDCNTGLVTLNGEPRNDLIDFDNEFFTLVGGINQLETSPNVRGLVRFNERYY